MVGSILSCRGKDFDVDSFLASSPWHGVARTYYKGDKSDIKGRPDLSASGLQIDITYPEHNLELQLQKTLAYLEKYDSEMQRLKNFQGIEEIELAIGSWWYSDTAAKVVTLSPKLISLAARQGIEINIGVYATSDDNDP